MTSPILSWGLEWIQALQAYSSPALDQIMLLITNLGAPRLYLLLLSIVWIVGNWRRGAWLSALLIFSAWLNLECKDWWAQPRPSDLVSALGKVVDPGYGLPSGHAQVSLVFWGALLLESSRRWLRVVALLLVPLIGVSRVYLGAHFPIDVLGGWALGALTLLLWWRLRPNMELQLQHLPPSARWALALVLPLIPLLHSLPGLVAISGFGVGIALGAALLAGTPRPTSQHTPHRLGRALFGLLSTGLLYVGLRALTKTTGIAAEPVAQCLSYGLIGIWMSYGAIRTVTQLRM